MSEPRGLTVTIEPPSHEPPPGPPTGRPRRPRRWLVALVAAAVVLASAGAAGALFWHSVQPPAPLTLPESTTLYYADGTVMARLGDVLRTELRYEEILPAVIDVAVAAEDPEFWSTMAGPITRAVVRHTLDLADTGVNSRVRTWILAYKMDEAYSKEETLTTYLNIVPFGRGAFGIEAAARAYFDKSASTTAPPHERLTTAEAMVLLALVRQPYPDPANPEASPGFDPSASPAAAGNSRQRWTEIRDSLAELARSPRARAVTEAEVAGLTYPEPLPEAPARLDGPVGLVANHVLAELTQTPGSPFQGWSWDAVRTGGFSIITTIDPKIQKILDIAAGGIAETSPMHGQPGNLQAAGVVVEPGSGRVLAYHGGPDPTGPDYAGVHRGEDGALVGFGAHPPGGSFLVYTFAAARRAGHSLDSQWQWTPHEQVGRDPAHPVRNASTCPTSPLCSLRDSLVYSLNVPFYDVTVSVGIPAVLTMARDLGITALWTDDGVRIDLAEADLAAPDVPFGFEVGIGQYPVTVLDQAAAMATLAAGGVWAPTHFVRGVTKGDEVVYAETLPTTEGTIGLTSDQVAELTETLTLTPGADGLALKTGVWEYGDGTGGNSDAWSIGYSRDLAAAVWVGYRGEQQPLLDKDGAPIVGSRLPTLILRQAVTATPLV